MDGSNLEGLNGSPAKSARRCLPVQSVVTSWRPEGRSPKMSSGPTIAFLQLQVDDTEVEGYASQCGLPQRLCHDHQECLQCQSLQNLPHRRRECRNIIDDDLGSDAASFAAHFLFNLCQQFHLSLMLLSVLLGLGSHQDRGIGKLINSSLFNVII